MKHQLDMRLVAEDSKADAAMNPPTKKRFSMDRVLNKQVNENGAPHELAITNSVASMKHQLDMRLLAKDSKADAAMIPPDKKRFSMDRVVKNPVKRKRPVGTGSLKPWKSGKRNSLDLFKTHFCIIPEICDVALF